MDRPRGKPAPDTRKSAEDANATTAKEPVMSKCSQEPLRLPTAKATAQRVRHSATVIYGLNARDNGEDVCACGATSSSPWDVHTNQPAWMAIRPTDDSIAATREYWMAKSTPEHPDRTYHLPTDGPTAILHKLRKRETPNKTCGNAESHRHTSGQEHLAVVQRYLSLTRGLWSMR